MAKPDWLIELEALDQMMDGGHTFEEALKFVKTIKENSPSLGQFQYDKMSERKKQAIREELEKKHDSTRTCKHLRKGFEKYRDNLEAAVQNELQGEEK